MAQSIIKTQSAAPLDTPERPAYGGYPAARDTFSRQKRTIGAAGVTPKTGFSACAPQRVMDIEEHPRRGDRPAPVTSKISPAILRRSDGALQPGVVSPVWTIPTPPPPLQIPRPRRAICPVVHNPRSAVGRCVRSAPNMRPGAQTLMGGDIAGVAARDGNGRCRPEIAGFAPPPRHAIRGPDPGDGGRGQPATVPDAGRCQAPMAFDDVIRAARAGLHRRPNPQAPSHASRGSLRRKDTDLRAQKIKPGTLIPQLPDADPPSSRPTPHHHRALRGSPAPPRLGKIWTDSTETATARRGLSPRGPAAHTGAGGSRCAMTGAFTVPW